MARDAFTADALLTVAMDTRNGICTTACGGRGLAEPDTEGDGRREACDDADGEGRTVDGRD